MKTLNYRLKKSLKHTETKIKSKTSTQNNVFQVNMKNIPKKKNPKILKLLANPESPI
jgi:hypothetical protein